MHYFKTIDSEMVDSSGTLLTVFLLFFIGKLVTVLHPIAMGLTILLTTDTLFFDSLLKKYFGKKFKKFLVRIKTKIKTIKTKWKG